MARNSCTIIGEQNNGNEKVNFFLNLNFSKISFSNIFFFFLNHLNRAIFIWNIVIVVIIVAIDRIHTQTIDDDRIWDSDEFERQSILFVGDNDDGNGGGGDTTFRSNLYPKLNNYKSAKKLLMKPLRYPLTSPYQVIPGSYRVTNDQYYGYNNNNNTYNVYSLYTKYLNNDNYYYGGKSCQQNTYDYGKQVTQYDLYQAFAYANNELKLRYQEYSNLSNYLDVDRKEIEGTMMELVSEYFARL